MPKNEHHLYEKKNSVYIFANFDKQDKHYKKIKQDKLKKKNKDINKDYYYMKKPISNTYGCNSCFNKNSCSRCNQCYNNCNSSNNWMNNNNCYEVLYNGNITVYKRCCSNSVDYNYD